MKVTDRVELIDHTMANCYFFELGGKNFLVDAGTKGTGKKIMNYLRQKGIKLDYILITHYHPDHVGGLKELSDAFQCKIIVSAADAPVVTGKQKIQPAKSLLSKMVAATMKVQPVQNVTLTDDFMFEGIEPVMTAGHTPGSVSYYLQSEDVLFVGDAVVNSGGDLKINRAFTRDLQAAEKSKEIIMKHPAKIILSGHGEPYRKVQPP